MATSSGSVVTQRRIERLASVVLVVATLAAVGWIFSEYIEWFGFPDGYTSELGTAENTMAVWFCWFSVATAVVLLALLWRSFFAPVGKPLLMACALYLLVAGGCVALDLHSRTYMMDSSGG